MSSISNSYRAARRKLRVVLVLFLIALAIPIVVLLVQVFGQLRTESFYNYRNTAEDLIGRINNRFAELLTPEEKRSFDEYGFYSVTSNTLLKAQGVAFSPLSQYPVSSTIPGLIGYFQVNPDGSLHSPVLPEGDDVQLAYSLSQLSDQELNQRIQLREKLRSILMLPKQKRNQLQDTKTKDEGRALRGRTYEAKDKSVLLGTTKLDALGALEEQAHQSGQRLADLEFDSSIFAKEANKPSSRGSNALLQSDSFMQKKIERSPRRETLNQVLQAPSEPVSASDENSQTFGAASPKNEQRQDFRERTLLNGEIFASEGEIEPFQVTQVSSGEFVFNRKVWRNNQRYVQGFVVKPEEFIKSVAGEIVGSSTMLFHVSLIVGYNGIVYKLFGAQPVQKVWDKDAVSITYEQRSAFSRDSNTRKDTLLYRANGLAPLQLLEFVFTTPELPLGPGANVVNALAWIFIIILTLGMYVLYRLGVQQIALVEQRSDFVSAISHELKTPLTSIRMYGEMLRSGMVNDEDKRKTYYDFIFFESERLSRLISNVLQVAKITNETAAFELQQVTVSTVIDLIRSKVSSQISAVGFELDIELQEDCAHQKIAVEQDALAQIFINLVDNALKFSKDAQVKKLIIGAGLNRSSPHTIELYVRDFGPGIDRKQQRKVFELFYRGESELTRKTPGTGIGLALVQELARKMRAKVSMCNREPGAEFQLSFNSI